MRRLLCFTVFLIVVSGCGGKKTVASKSADAYRNAVQKGSPVATGGQGHGATTPGSTTEDAAAHGMTAEDHAAMGHTTTKQDHAAMGHGTATQDHAAIRHGTATQAHAGMNHGAATQDHAAMGHTAAPQDHAAMGHGATPAQSGAHAGHASASGAIPPGGLWGPVPGTLVNPPEPDTPAPIAVEEAKKAAGASPTMPSHEGHR